MTTVNPSQITALDFQGIKQNIIAFYQSQPEFTDYNFTGSGLQVLIDNLAYNASYMGFYASMGFSEKYLDSAVTRAAVVSAAKDLGYNPRSATSAIVNVDITVSGVSGSPSSITLPIYSKFIATLQNADGTISTFTFVNTEAITTTKIGNSYVFSNVTLTEGTPLSYNYVVGNETSFVYEIPNANIDNSTINVTVQNSISDSTSINFSQYNTLVDIDGTSAIYFVGENYKGNTQVEFGDGIIGRSVAKNNVIIIHYIASSGSVANGVTGFVLDQSVFNASSSFTTLSLSSVGGGSGGSDPQSIESIKFTAPKSYVAQNRLVTVNDFAAEVSSISSIESVSVWGGEDNVPPVYGSVFISAKPVGGLYLSATLQNNILQNNLNPKKVAIITPTFVDPDYTYINISATAKYNSQITNLGIGDMEQIIRTAIATYQTNSLGRFNSNFLYEPFLNFLANSDTSIISTYATTRLQKRIVPALAVDYSVDIAYNTALSPATLQSTRFYMFLNGAMRLVSFRDSNVDGITGTLQLIDIDSGIVYNNNCGMVTYATGEVSITPIIISTLPTNFNDVRISASVAAGVFDIDTLRNNILLFDDSSIDTTYNMNNGVNVNVLLG